MERYIMSLDEGTSSARAILFDRAGNVVSLAQREFRQIYPRAGWVEHDANEIWSTQLSVAREVIHNAGIGADQIAAIGITNQRETCLIWDRKTGNPLSNAIVWQDRRTAGACDHLKAKGLERYVKDATGLVIDAYFSGTKLAWILDNTPGARERAARGELAGGTIDSWLIWNLTGGKVHVTDASNASRTLLFNIGTGDWDERLLAELNVPRSILPEVRDSSEIYGVTQAGLFGREVPVASSIGDQQGALFGQSCFSEGMVKATYGTGGTLLMNTGPHMRASENGLLTTVAWRLGGKLEYALEGTLFSVGSVVQWLRDELKIIHSASETEVAALEVPDTNGVYIVPAFNGLSAPFWDQYARGTIVGITRGANRNHLIRASLESMAYQIRDVIGRMEADSGLALAELKVDGGAAMNNFVLQFQADQLGVRVLRPKVIDTTARGAAFLAGLAVGYWENMADLHTAFALDREFNPSNDRATADMLYRGWCRTVDRSRDWAEHE
ncbi:MULTISPECIES: glycerol kinase GlpK [unclassified Rhizobium]|uniref:glycerol kinase GlpK n=1 Tax=unclassified Rhizobium TaxID=2613769 RepID=UPI00146C016D|nr:MULTISPECIES: glycerol kinase GlpK [unclassified Rhizobium]NMN71517.1 glycerol kinase [Rhizobium sp. 57MFTsu3.2]